MLQLASRPRRTVAESHTSTSSRYLFSRRSITRFCAAVAAGSVLASAAFFAPQHTMAQPVAASLAILGMAGSGDAAFTVPVDSGINGIQRFGAPLTGTTRLRIAVAVGNLRRGPSTTTHRLARLRWGTPLTVIAQQDQWYHVQTAAGTGWVAAEIVEADSSQTDAIPATTADVSASAATGSALGHSIAHLAMNYVGYPYRYGSAGPYAFDCSGLTSYVYSRFGIGLPHQASSQWHMGGTRIRNMGSLQAGDLVFFANTAGWGISHAAIYVGNGMMVTANAPRTGVQLSRITDSYWRAHWAGGLRLT